MIRNIKQSHGEREIIKTAPDAVVYIENMPYVFNQWVTDDQKLPISVNINEFITNISVSAGVESMIPNCTITLNVPNHLRYMFQAPGGNRILNSMDEIQVFCKGYYMSAEGRTMYHRIFHGIISSISYAESGGSLDISLSCDGILKLLEIMLISENPAVGAMGGSITSPYIDQFGEMNPYGIIAAMFRMSLDTKSVLSQTNVSQAVNPSEVPEYARALEVSQSMKWGPKLRRLSKLVRVYGLSSKDLYNNYQKDPFQFTLKAPNQKGNNVTIKRPESKTLSEVTFGKIEEYLPSMGIGSLSLLNSRVISRLEKLRTIAEGVMFEVYQDLGGEIIVKPPLYNLDVTMLHDRDDNGNEIVLDSDLVEENNPFVIYASEVESEHETEDQSQIRFTRVTVQGSWDPGIQMSSGETLRGVGVFCDVGLASRFGIRDAGVKQIGYAPQCSKSLFALAVNELIKANRSYRTYTCTIPVRPELRLGIPVYITHHDMYAYPRTVSVNYSRGGTATMTLSCDTLRKRPMVPVQVKVKETIPGPNGGPGIDIMVDKWVYKSIPNLVYKWCRLSDIQKKPKEESNNPIGDLASAPAPDLPKEFARLKAYSSDRLGALVETKPDSRFASWVIQDGGKDSADGGFNKDKPHKTIDPQNRRPDKGKPTSKGVSPSKNIICDDKYLELCTTMLPYTDEKGYELVGPFPLGRWIPLDKALEDVFQDGYITPPPESKVWTRITDSGTAFVFSGMGTFKGDMVNSILSVADDLSNSKRGGDEVGGGVSGKTDSDYNRSMENDLDEELLNPEPYIRSFELAYDDPASTEGGSLDNQASKDKTPTAIVEVTENLPKGVLDRVEGFLDAFHTWASKPGEGQGSNSRSNFRGRLGKLSNDIKFHPNEPSVGNSFLADRMSSGFSNYLKTAGSSFFSNKKES